MKTSHLASSLCALALGFAGVAQAQVVVTPVSISGTGEYYNSLGLGADVLIDGVTPDQGTNWQDPVLLRGEPTDPGSLWTNGHDNFWFPAGTSNYPGIAYNPSLAGFGPGGSTVWWDLWSSYDATYQVAANDVQFTIDYGFVFKLTDVTLSLDNNDSFLLEYSADGSTFNPLLTYWGGSGNVHWGVDTVTTINSSLDFVATMDFSAVNTRYLRLSSIRDAAGGDNIVSAGEVIAYTERKLDDPTPVPEPSTYGAMGVAALVGLAALRRRKQSK